MKTKKWLLLTLFLAIASLLLLGGTRGAETAAATPRQTAETMLRESGASAASCVLKKPADCCLILRLNRIR